MSRPPPPPPADPRGTVAVIPFWNGLRFAQQNLSSWQSQRPPFLRIVCVDNGSRDGTADWLARQSAADLIRLPRNRGFAAAANIGLRAALARPDADAVALINNDVTLDPGWNGAARAVLFSAADVGACAGCLLQARNPGRIDSAGIVWTRPGWAENARHGEAAVSDAPSEVQGVSAGAALYRPEYLRAVGGFDERLFAYQEDVDLSLRGRRAGWRYLYAPAARGVHAGHGSNRKFPLGGTWADYYNARNRLYVFIKNGPGPVGTGQSGAAFRTLLRAAVRSLAEGRGGAVWAGLLHGLLWWPLARRARTAPPPALVRENPQEPSRP